MGKGRRRGRSAHADAHDVMHRADAPERERQDAQMALAKAFAPKTASDLIMVDEIRNVIDMIESGGIYDSPHAAMMGGGGDGAASAFGVGGGTLAKSWFGDEGNSGKKTPWVKREGGGPKSILIDDMVATRAGDYYERPTPMAFEDQRRMVAACAPLNAAILTNIRKVQRFAHLVERDRQLGFECRPKRRSAESANLKEIEQLEEWFMNCGDEGDPHKRKAKKRDNLSQFLAKLVRDTYTGDFAAIETELTQNGKSFSGMYAIDGATIRLASEHGYEGDDSVAAIQLVQGRPMKYYEQREIIYEPRNPRTDLRVAGYGYGETEMFVRMVTGFLNAVTLNIKGFDSNAIPKGILTLFGDFEQKQLDFFKRQWNAMVRGVNNRWAMPILAARGKEGQANFQTLGPEFSEMHFAKWMTFIVSVICACFGMDPAEINFESFSARNSSLSGSDTAEKLASARDKGFEPLMSWIETLFSDFICSKFFNGRYVFRFLGLREEDQGWEHEVQKTTFLVDELRKRQGYKPMKNKVLGNAPVNPVLMQIYLQQLQASMGGGDPNGGGAPGAQGAGAPPGGAEGGIDPATGPTPEQTEGMDFGVGGRGEGEGPGARRGAASPGDRVMQDAREVISGERMGKSWSGWDEVFEA